MNLNPIVDALQPMLNSKLRNYIVPGLDSYLVGGVQPNGISAGTEFGKVRLFDAVRQTFEFVTPHNHRFDFTCLVLRGMVKNTIFWPGGENAELWCPSTIAQVCGANGLLEYNHVRDTEPTPWSPESITYVAGETYSMTFAQIHSIKFWKGAKVLFFEGPPKAPTSTMLEPWVDGRCIPTFRTEPWMFER